MHDADCLRCRKCGHMGKTGENKMSKMKKREIPRSSGGSVQGRTVGDGRGAAHDATSSITVS